MVVGRGLAVVVVTACTWGLAVVGGAVGGGGGAVVDVDVVDDQPRSAAKRAAADRLPRLARLSARAARSSAVGCPARTDTGVDVEL